MLECLLTMVFYDDVLMMLGGCSFAWGRWFTILFSLSSLITKDSSVIQELMSVVFSAESHNNAI